jgi:GT2 family glycosyltransferase
VSRLAVIVVNYNAGGMLQDCLAALARQSVRPARVLVMDNGSRDGSIEACRPLFPWVEFHLLGANEGFAKANNVAVDLVPDCEWVAFLNPDAFAEPAWIEAFQRRAAEYPDTDAFASCMLWAIDPRIVDGTGDAYRVDGLAWARRQGGQAADLPDAPEDVFSPSAGAGFYRRSAFVQAGGFCERYFCYYEDVDLGFRLRLRGHRCRFLPDAVVHHVGSALTGKGSEFSVYHAHRNFVWTYLRNMPGHLVWVYLPAHLAANLASMVVFLRKGQARVILRAKWHAVRGLVPTLRERRLIQAERKVSPEAVLAAMQRGNLFLWVYRRALRAVGLRDA